MDRGHQPKVENDQGSVIFEAKPKVACPECDIPVIYGDTQKSNVLGNNDVEDVAISREQPECFCTNAAAGAGKSGVSGEDRRAEFLPRYQRSRAFTELKSADTNRIFGEPDWQEVPAGVQVVICSVAISAGKPVPLTVPKMRGSRVTVGR